MTIGDFFTMAAVIVAACLVYNFVKAYTKKKYELLQRKIGEKDEKKQHKKNLKRSICHVNGVLYRIYNTGIDR